MGRHILLLLTSKGAKLGLSTTAFTLRCASTWIIFLDARFLTSPSRQSAFFPFLLYRVDKCEGCKGKLLKLAGAHPRVIYLQRPLLGLFEEVDGSRILDSLCVHEAESRRGIARDPVGRNIVCLNGGSVLQRTR